MKIHFLSHFKEFPLRDPTALNKHPLGLGTLTELQVSFFSSNETYFLLS